MVRTIVKRSRHGMGLYANSAIAHHRLIRDRTIVVKFKGKRMTMKKWETYYIEKGIPHDSSFIFFNYVLYDPKFTKKHIPKWYRINHSYNPNVRIQKKGTDVEWITLRDIKKGEELRFHYGRPDPKWSKTI